MTKRLLFTLTLISAFTVPAYAQLVGIGWDDAPSRGGTQNRLSTCGSNTGSNTFVLTIRPPVDMLAVSEVDLVLLVQGGDLGTCDPFGGPPCPIPQLAPWWNFSSGGCRPGALSSSADFTVEPWASSTTVEDPWGGAAYFAALPYQFQTVPDGTGGTRTRGLYAMYVAPAGGSGTVDLLAGHEYYFARVTVGNAHSVDPGGCTGCCAPAVIFPTQVQVTNATNQFPVPFVPSGAIIGWQSFSNGCSATPVRTQTWGALKSTYR